MTRFRAPRLHNEVRWLLLNSPERAIEEPEALQVLLGGCLPNDVSFQLKVLYPVLIKKKADITSTSYTGHLPIPLLPSPSSFLRMETTPLSSSTL